MEVTQAIKLIKEQPAKAKLADAIRHETRLELHSRKKIDAAYYSYGPLLEFLEPLKHYYSKKLFDKIVSQIRLPVQTVPLVDEIYQNLEKVFRAKNPIVNHKISDERYENAVMDYFKEYYGADFWRDFFERQKWEVNSVMYVDFPEVEMEESRPMVYFIRVDQVIAFNGNNELDYLAFVTGDSEKKYYVIDDEYYRVFDENLLLKTEVQHDFGYCPARWMWTDSMDSKKGYLKANEVTAHLGSLDRLLKKHLTKVYVDDHNAAPIFWMYERKCDYRSDSEMCKDGYLLNISNRRPIYDGGSKLKECPICSSKNFTGPGTVLDVPIPTKDQQSLAPPVGMVQPDIDSLKHNDEAIEKLEKSIYEAAVGSSYDLLAKEAVNQDQVKAGFEARTQVLQKFKLNFEEAMCWVFTTVGKGLIGDTYKGCDVNLGTEWYLVPDQIIKAEYEQTIKGEASSLFADAILDEYINTKYQNNPGQIEKFKIIQAIDPAIHQTTEVLTTLQTEGIITREEKAFKMNMWRYIRDFEMLYGPIENYLPELEFQQRVELIKNLIFSKIKFTENG